MKNKSYFFFIKFFYFIISIGNFNYLKSEEFHIELLKKLEASFPAEIYFSQIDSKNINSKGWMVIGSKGLARVEFEPPNHFVMVADGNWLIVHDAQYDRTSYLPLDGGILGAMLGHLIPGYPGGGKFLGVFPKLARGGIGPLTAITGAWMLGDWAIEKFGGSVWEWGKEAFGWDDEDEEIAEKIDSDLKNLSKDQLKEDNFLSDIKIEELLTEIVRSFSEISKKKLSLFTAENKVNPQIERTLEITYGLRNFIGNAVKYSNSLVEISIISNNKTTEVKVGDDGPGFSEDILNVLGEPYIRSKNAMINKKSGLGLGTFIGKTLLERMKANVQFEKYPKTNGAMVIIKWQTKDLLSI